MASRRSLIQINGAIQELSDSDQLLGYLPIAAIATLVVADWSDNEQTVSATSVTTSNIVLVAPAVASQEDYVSGGVKCTEQGSGTLTFTCTTTPTSDIDVNVVTMEAAAAT